MYVHRTDTFILHIKRRAINLDVAYASDYYKLPLHAHDVELHDIWDTFFLQMNELS